MFLPQMSPMLWVYLSMLFILTMIMSINIMYFNYSNQINKDIKTHKKMMNWVW